MKQNRRFGLLGISLAATFSVVPLAAEAGRPGARQSVRTRVDKAAGHAKAGSWKAPPCRVTRDDVVNAPRVRSLPAGERTKPGRAEEVKPGAGRGLQTPPANDLCANAEVIAGEGTFPFDNSEAAEESDGPEHNGLIPYGCVDAEVSPLGTIAHDVWYLWTSTDCTGPVRVETCGTTTVDTKIAVYNEGTCSLDDSNLFTYGCIDDALGDCGVQSSVTFPAVSGQSYMIRLGTFPGSPPDDAAPGGSGEFTITCLTPPCEEPPENCQQAPAEQAEAVINSNGTDFLTVDDFSPAATGSVTEVCWWGTYVGLYAGEYVDCQTGTTDDFVIRYYSDAGGLPGSLIAGPFTKPVCSNDGEPCLVDDDCKRCSLTRVPCQTNDDCLIQETCAQMGTCTDPSLHLDVSGPTPTGYAVLGFREFEYTGAHPPVPVDAGECYWVEISNTLTQECSWFWEASLEGNGRAYQDDDLFDPPTYQPLEFQPLDDLAFCVDVATADPALCNPPPAANDNCADSMVVFEGYTEFDTSSANTDGPPEPACNFPVEPDQIEQDIWFDYVATCSDILTVDLCTSVYDTRVAVYEGDACPPDSGAPIGCNDDACGPGQGLQSKVSVPVRRDQPYKIRVGGYDAWFGPGVMFISCADAPPGPCETSTNDCCVEHTALEGPGCNDQACCELICALDDFCCMSTWYWDSSCASAGEGFYRICSETVQTCNDDTNCPAGETCGPRTSSAGDLCSHCFPCPDGAIVFVDPPSDIHDARQPHPVDDAAAAQGYDVFVVDAPETASADCWTVCESASSGTNFVASYGPNKVCSISGSQCDTTADCVVSGEVCVADGHSRVTLDHPLMPGAFTTLTYQSTYLDTVVTGRFTALPGDVNEDGQTTNGDLGALIGCLSDPGTCGLRQCDLDRGGTCAGADLERLVDLLNGADAYVSWDQATPATEVVCPPSSP